MPITYLDEEEEDFASPLRQTPLTQPKRRKITYFDEEPAERKAGLLPPIEEMFKPKPKPTGDGFFRQAADIPVGLAKGAAQGVRMFTDIAGADNPVSQSIRGVEDYLGNLMSAQAKEDQAEIARIMQDAQDKGVLDQVMAGVKAFSVAPVDMTVQALGTMAPVIAGGLAANVAKVAATGIRGGVAAARGLTAGQMAATQAGIGAGMGAGVVKGTIYDEVKNELISQGLSEDAAHQQAVKAQEYGGKNLDQILLGAGLGAAAATTGAEKIIGGILTKTGVAASKSRIGNALKTGITEAFPEAAQGAQEQLAANLALQREGMEVPTTRGVFSSGALEGIAGFGVGAPLGAIQKASVAEDAAIKAEEANAPQTAAAIRAAGQKAATTEKDISATEQAIEETEAATRPTVPIREEEPYVQPPKEEFKAAFARMTPESIAETEANFREQLQSEDEETRVFSQNALDALAEFRAEQARARKLPTDVLPTETPGATYGREADIYDVFADIRRKPMPPSGPAFESAQVIEAAARRADILRRTPEGRDLLRRELQGEEMVGGVRRATEEALATAPEPAEGDVFAGIRRPSRAEEAAITIEQQLTEDERIRRSQLGAEALREELAQAESLSRVADNTATDEEVVRLARQGLVNIQDGQNVITPRGEEVMQRGGAPLPRLTPEERAAEVAAAPVAIVEQAPTPTPVTPAPTPVTTPPVIEAVTPAPAAPTPAVPAEAAPVGIAVGDRIKKRKGPTTFIVLEALEPSPSELRTGERSYVARNERTGEVETINTNDRPSVVQGKGAMRVAADIRTGEERVAKVPKNKQYTYDELVFQSDKFFGKMIPENFMIVNITDNPDYEFKAAYNARTGQIMLNQAYLSREDSIADNLTHELGHFIYSDPRFQKAFINFWDTLSTDDKSKIDDIINRLYKRETREIKIEERQVFAFNELVKTGRKRTAWEVVKDAIKAFLNRFFGQKFVLSDAGAMSVFSSAYKRFKRGDRIVREMQAGILRTPPEEMTQMDRDYLAAVERGDMETAQRMVDEAAKAAGYNVRAYHGTTAAELRGNQFDDQDIPYRGGLLAFFADQKKFAQDYASDGGRVFDVLLRFKQLFDYRDKQLVRSIVSDFYNATGGITISEDIHRLEIGDGKDADSGNISDIYPKDLFVDAILQGRWDAFEATQFASWLQSDGFDGVAMLENGSITYGIYEPNQVKSADPVTYDDAGNVIPLSQRFQPTQRDIRRMAPEPAPEAVVEEAQVERPKRRTKMQNIIDISTGVKRPKTKLTVNEMTALKDQIKMRARRRREDKRSQREFAEELTKEIREMTIRGKVRPAQLRVIMSKALRTQFDNEASINGFTRYVDKVIENANYEKDLSSARATIKEAQRLAKQKTTPGNISRYLSGFISIDPRDIEPDDMSEREVEVDGEIVREKPISLAEFSAVLREYMKAAGPVEAKDYTVIPDTEIADFLSKLGEQVKKNQDDQARAALAKRLEKALENKALLPAELDAVLNSSAKEYEDYLAKKQEDRRKKIENAINSLAEEAQIALAKYDNPEISDDEKSILDFMKRVTLSDMSIGNRKNYIRIANNILVNNKFFGSEKFSSIAKGQIGALEASQDSKKIKRNSALIKAYNLIFRENLGPEISLGMQSFADTMRNITRPEEGVRLLYQMGFGDLERGRAASNEAKRKFTEAVEPNFKRIEEKTGQKINDSQGLVSSGVAATLIQIHPDETEAEGIQRMRGLIESDIERKKNSWKKEDRKTAILVEKALNEVYADSIEGILQNLKNTHPANYEVLTFLMNTVLPSYKPLFKKHDEMFNNQSDNYENPYYLPIRYRRISTEPVDPSEGIGNRMEGVASPKQSPNSIKRVKNSALPENMQFDYNLVKNVIDSVSSQLDATYMNPGLQQVHSFLTSEYATKALGGAENVEVVRKRINSLVESRDRRAYDMTGWSRVFDTFANGLRNVGTTMLLGGIGQLPKQVPAQMLGTVINVNDKDITSTAVFETKAALPVLRQFSIGERGEIAGGARWISQLDTGYSKLERYIEDGVWSKIKDAMENLANVWLYGLKKGDSFAAAHGWISYYKKYLKDNDMPFTNWDNEARLVAEGDRGRVQAGLYADTQVDLYQGASDPTKMATFAQRGKTGAENMMKTIFLPFSSFAIQERTRFLTDLRDVLYGDAEEKKKATKGLMATISGIVTFHWVRRYALPAMFGYLAYGLYGLLGVEMDEPDEEEEKEKDARTFRKFLGEIAANITVGGYSSIAENALIDSVNYMAYQYDKLNETENALNGDGDVMSWDKYRKERAPFYRYTGPGADVSLGMVGVIPDQLKSVQEKLANLSDEELMDSLTDEEKRVLILAGISDILYSLRLNDADVARMMNRMSDEIKKQAEERKKAQRRLQRLYGQ